MYPDKIIELFRQQYGTAQLLLFSPGRINLIGEHIDYNDGFVLPAAINKGIYYAVAANNSSTINITAADYNEQLCTSTENIQKSTGWKNYILSVIHEFLLAGKNISGFNCVFGGDIPPGSGMSSSAAVEGGLAMALNCLFDCGFSRKELALLCQRAEHNYPGVHCGIMDQYANMLGKKDHVLLLDCKTITHQYFPLQQDEYCIVLINSKVHHSLAAGEYNKRRQSCEEGLALFKKNFSTTSFRDATAEMLEKSKTQLSSNTYNCCSYVIAEINRTQLAADLLQQNNLIDFGKLMYATHEGLSALYNVSCNELDFLVNEAKQYNTVAGARLMGGGFGGCTINLVHKEAAASFAEKILDAYYKKYRITSEAYFVETSNGTCVL